MCTVTADWKSRWPHGRKPYLCVVGHNFPAISIPEWVGWGGTPVYRADSIARKIWRMQAYHPSLTDSHQSDYWTGLAFTSWTRQIWYLVSVRWVRRSDSAPGLSECRQDRSPRHPTTCSTQEQSDRHVVLFDWHRGYTYWRHFRWSAFVAIAIQLRKSWERIPSRAQPPIPLCTI